MLTKEQKEQFSEILEELGNSLDITKTQYDAAVKSYSAVGDWLSKPDSILYPYGPEILPQGSFMLGTMIQPITVEDDLDIDLVCQLDFKEPMWTQKILKHKTGDQLKSNNFYNNLLQFPDGRRCWTLKYRESSINTKERYHMDILPCVVGSGYKSTLNEVLLKYNDISDVERLAIRITDRERTNYDSERNEQLWLKSNPFGYAKWFYFKANVQTLRTVMLSEAVQKVPKFQKEKLPLQRVVQILKRHRDMMWKDRDDKDDKPISIIITTLAGQSYNKETNVIEALVNVVSKMRNFISDTNPHNGWNEYWVMNPVNNQENFADKWKTYPERKENFYDWLDAIEKDVNNITQQKGIQLISESMKRPFGSELITKTFSNYAANQLKKRESGELKMASQTGLIGSSGTTVKRHDFHGK
jgi:hypothetical protein